MPLLKYKILGAFDLALTYELEFRGYDSQITDIRVLPDSERRFISLGLPETPILKYHKNEWRLYDERRGVYLNDILSKVVVALLLKSKDEEIARLSKFPSLAFPV